jgi:methyl-accepting chemotaxis protein
MHASPTLPSIAFPNRAAGVSAKLQFGDNGWETSMGNGTAIEQTNLSGRHLLAALRAFRKGNFSVRLPIDLTGLDGEIADAFNDVVELNERMSKEIERLSHIVGKQGKIGHRAKLPNATGLWAANIDMVNDLIGDMVQPTGEMARVIGAVAKGDL